MSERRAREPSRSDRMAAARFPERSAPLERCELPQQPRGASRPRADLVRDCSDGPLPPPCGDDGRRPLSGPAARAQARADCWTRLRGWR